MTTQIIETYFECGGFDHRFIQGGTSVYLWQLSRAMARQGRRVSIVTPAHGRLDDLRRYHDLEELEYRDAYRLPLVLDPATWHGFGPEVGLDLVTTAHRLRLDGVDLYFLSNDMLDRLPDRFYPPYHSKGQDLVFFKPLVYQVDTIRFIRHRFAGEQAVVHAHEPYYHYLLPAAFRDDPDKTVVGTVQSNMPITKAVYRPKVARLLEFLGVDVVLPAGPPTGPRPAHATAMSQYQQLTHLHYEYPADTVPVFDLVAEYADGVDFLSPGHRDFYSTFADTPFEQLFGALPVAGTVKRNAAKRFVGGCAIGADWVDGRPPARDRATVLTELGLDPSLPAFYHNARYAVHHKGQVELIRAVDRALRDGAAATFVIRCLSDAGIDDPLFHQVAAAHPGRVHLQWQRVDDERIRELASAADFCLFPSKFEMDTFLIAQGEAMATGAVPIATAQCGMAHFGHVADPLTGPHAADATGFAVNRSFHEDDPLLVDALTERIHRAVDLWRDRPEQYRRLSANAAARARTFTWERAARQHLDAFDRILAGQVAVPLDDVLRYGWFDLLADADLAERPDEIAAAALARGDADTYRRCRPLTEAALRDLFDRAWQRADIPACQRIAALARDGHRDLADAFDAALTGRCRVDADGTVVYRMPHADRVQVVVPDLAAPLRGRCAVHDLKPDAGTFTGQVPVTGRSLSLLVTLGSGRAVWDEVPS